MNFFEKIGLVESVPEEEPNLNSSCGIEATTPEADPVNVTPTISMDEIVNEIYHANNLADTSASVYKVKELIATIPPETPEKTSKPMILNLLGVLNLPIATIRADAEARIHALETTRDATLADYENQRNEYLATIAQMEQEIQTAKEQIQQLNQQGELITAAVQHEGDSIIDTLAFIGATEVTPDAAQ